MLTSREIKIVKATTPALDCAGVNITKHFYNRMFSCNPELKNIFNMSNQESGKQPFALFSAISTFSKNIDNLPTLQPLIERVAQKHTSYFIQPDQYETIGKHLLATLAEFIPDTFTPEVIDAWQKAYELLAKLLIDREHDIYTISRNGTGGWYGPRRFIVADKTIESELVTSFTLKPEDRNTLLGYRPGQYLGVRVKPPAHKNIEIRQYSLSDKPNSSTYRISVKRESQPRDGIVSSFLHDTLQMGDILEAYPPSGAFFLKETARPVVLISAGVGITPLLSMLESIHEKEPDRQITFLHACEKREQHSFKGRVAHLTSRNSNIKHHYWYASGAKETSFSGLMDLEFIREQLPIIQGGFYLCGPTGFMKYIKGQLIGLQVSSNRIFYEAFGPHSDI
ncbi:NO-inducible flavohemoprotein [Microbulbifer sp. OS29]|uniref:Flavohemoprotein n=1 Tax=Microbulbifer okhotskensis TaxID=2926617 RepID=A0A9X2ES43_9GAMM|nr:NO-inducible flavohemoprotein [Microbulbifer okhotskensis]MCO1336380.1 NO-inducible flavohemoprotein [Microbulbifer okhotskensis]